MNHKLKCVLDAAAYKRLLKEYTDMWPNYCRRCRGSGLYTFFDDPSPAGVSLAPGVMEFAEACSDCVEKGICPRCGKQVWDDDVDWPQPCPECGWVEDETEVAPSIPECYC